MLSREERNTLLQVAAESIRNAVAESERADFVPRNITPNLKQPCGAFVSIYSHRSLRGCIGYIVAEEPLIETVRDVAAKAATEDPRFFPIAPEELNSLHLEISVLTPMMKVKNFNEIIVGTHGLMIEAKGHRGLLLPQVATKYHWDREQFLEETCTKAGLPKHTWKEPGSIVYMFSAEVFEEEQT